MDILIPTLNQMIFLFIFNLLGYIVTKTGHLSTSAAAILSKLENLIFIPALVMGTFIKNFTMRSISTAWKILLFSTVLELILIPVLVFVSKLCAKDAYTQRIYTYGLCFSNFAFMGNAIVQAIFPEHFSNYILFTLPLWVLIYVWAVPSLLVDRDEEKQTLGMRLKKLLNPMFVGLILGMVIGLLQIPLPESILSVIEVSGNCMSPIAMLLTGITLAQMDLRKVLKRKSIYAVTTIRLLLIPAIALAVLAWIPCPEIFAICTVCSLSMPLGLNTIVIPGAYGKDVSTASGMALVSHLLSLITIPLVFVGLKMIIGS
ncbi:MAG: AEC family transporter [Clostridia bacterium]|nr:AEC family transporter [Clostridia bacterium]